MSAHDNWLANYHADVVTAYCANPKCGNHDGANVTYVSEYGQGWYEPEECGSCGGEWLEDRPSYPCPDCGTEYALPNNGDSCPECLAEATSGDLSAA